MHRHSPSCRCGRSWRDNLARVVTLVAGVDRIAQGTSGAVDMAWSHAMSGRAGGAIRTGDGSDPAYKFSGYLAYTRNAVIPPGASRTLRHSPNIALPATHGDVRTLGRSSVAEHLARLTPGGARR